MDAGKAAAQAVHAARLSLLRHLQNHPDQAVEFHDRNSIGSFVVLDATTLTDIERLATLATLHELPWAMFVDSEHVLLPHFDGSPITTALAIGPAQQSRIKPLVRKYRCLKGTQS